MRGPVQLGRDLRCFIVVGFVVWQFAVFAESFAFARGADYPCDVGLLADGVIPEAVDGGFQRERWMSSNRW